MTFYSTVKTATFRVIATAIMVGSLASCDAGGRVYGPAEGVSVTDSVRIGNKDYERGETISIGIASGGDRVNDVIQTVTVKVDPNLLQVGRIGPDSEIQVGVLAHFGIDYEVTGDYLVTRNLQRHLENNEERIVSVNAANGWTATFDIHKSDVILGRSVNVMGLQGKMIARHISSSATAISVRKAR